MSQIQNSENEKKENLLSENSFSKNDIDNTEQSSEDTGKKPTLKENLLAFLSIFVPTKGYFITPILIDINIIIFIVMAILGVDIMEPNIDDLLSYGANYRPVTLDGQWWRLLSACFLHIGALHLVMNMYALSYIGVLLEPILGKSRFLIAYLLTGIVASTTSIWWNPLTVSAGASGAIFGMYGVFLALLTTDLIELEARKPLLASIGIFVVFNLVIGLNDGIDNAAHIGGLASGIAIGYFLIISLDDYENKFLKFKNLGIISVVFLVLVTMVYNSLTNDILIYNTKMKDFQEMEKMALEVYNQANYYPKENLLYNIKDRGIYYWNENINIIDEVDKLDLPKEIHERNAKMKKYCELRIKLFNLLYKSISEGSNKYNSEIQNYNKQIEHIINDIGSTK